MNQNKIVTPEDVTAHRNQVVQAYLDNATILINERLMKSETDKVTTIPWSDFKCDDMIISKFDFMKRVRKMIEDRRWYTQVEVDRNEEYLLIAKSPNLFPPKAVEEK